jgi:hypothetical protein
MIMQLKLRVKSEGRKCQPGWKGGYCAYIVVGFRGPLQNYIILGISCSCTERIDVFS